MFGYACDETPDLLPAPIRYAHRLAKQLHSVRSTGRLPYLRPDGKTQVTCVYDDTHTLVRIDTIVISTQHAPDVSQETIRADLLREVIAPVVGNYGDAETIYHINPTGQFII
jgi:S-adenosylmethionine synthetase